MFGTSVENAVDPEKLRLWDSTVPIVGQETGRDYAFDATRSNASVLIGEKSPMPQKQSSQPASGEVVDKYFATLCRESLKCAWHFVIENRVPAFICALLGPGLGAWLEWQFGAQSKDDMMRALSGAGWGLLATFALFAGVFFVQCFYAIPKRRLAAALARIRELEEESAALQQARHNPLIIALDELDALYTEGNHMATLFQCKGATLPRFTEAVAWNDKAIASVKQEILEDHISLQDWAKFKENWNFADCQRIERVLREHACLDNATNEQCSTLRFLWGRVKRLGELIAKIKGLTGDENKTPIESLTEFLFEVHSLLDVFACLASPLPLAEQNDLFEKIRQFLRKTTPEYVDRFNEIVKMPPPARVVEFPEDFTADDKEEWSRTRSEPCDRLHAIAAYLTRIISELRSKLPS